MNDIETRDRMNRMKFNMFDRLSEVPNKIVMEYLWKNENLWKLLYYTLDEKKNPIPKPLEMPDLTAREKRGLIYQGVGDIKNCRVFFTMFPQNEEINEQIQQLRIYRAKILPSNAFRSGVAWRFDLPCHFRSTNDYS